jgi:hypothetical protein
VVLARYVGRSRNLEAISCFIVGPSLTFGMRFFNGLAFTIFTQLEVCGFAFSTRVFDRLVCYTEAPRKPTAPIITLVACKLWNERNSRIFRHISNLPSMIISDIKEEAKTT